ncbi:hypothetical protein CBG25_17225 [Arsenophonus sp. ENCA]|uniref:transposase family protein n=1 Tax=Arsenophonus sp. ENCA TaxID=1987579 RepID=UPI000BD16D24|nr:transposase family protein [Arsenophonus sp. ENCA]PAV01340.1 hypothetical protein CBG25_17225 [Arsenophonus sp. ENCA]
MNLRRRKKMYSGKKRQTTRKGLIMTDETRQIGFIPMSKNGRRHDKRLLDKVDIIRHIPPEVTIWADTGTSFAPIKKRSIFKFNSA